MDVDDAARFVGRAINGPVRHGLRRGLDGAEGCHGIFEGVKRADEAVTLFSQKAAGARSAPADEKQVPRQPQRDVPVTDAGRVNADEPRVMKRRARRIQFGKKRQRIKRRFAYSSGQGTEGRLDVSPCMARLVFDDAVNRLSCHGVPFLRIRDTGSRCLLE